MQLPIRTTARARWPLALGLLAVIGARPTAQQGGEEVVYHWQRIVRSDGSSEVCTPVTDLADWLDSGGGWIDLEELVDSRGLRYRVVADAWQTAEDAPVHYEIRVLRDQVELVTEAEIEADWWLGNENASRAEFEAFLRKRRERPDSPPSEVSVDQELFTWMATADAGEELDVAVLLKDVAPLDLPAVASSLFASEPAFGMRQMERRLIAIEQRKTALETSQAPVIADLEAAGGRLIKRYWLIDGFECRVTPGALQTLVSDGRLARVERVATGVPDGTGGGLGGGVGGLGGGIGGATGSPGSWGQGLNDLADMRTAAQIQQFHNSGYEGETPSGRSSASDIHVAIIDSDVDADHPAWNDSGPAFSRLLDVWRWDGNSWGTVSTSATTGESHGTKVAGVAMGDLMQGQDPAIVLSSEQNARTGFATEASFSFIEEGTAGATTSIEKAVDLSADVINLSMSFGICNLSATSNDAVDAAMLDGIFLAKSASNNGNTGSTCNIGDPGTASGAFTVGACNRSAQPLKEGLILSGSSRGGDALGRAVVAMAAATGPEAERTAAVGDTYGVFGATSGASPVVAGSAAVLKEHLIDVFGSALINEAGYMYAAMLLMGDGMQEDGTIAMAFDPADDVYGMGRLRMRMFNTEGMDAPWRMRLFGSTIDQGEHATNLLVNPDANGVNQPLSIDVERLRAAAFWHEPNVEDGSAFTADISLHIVDTTGSTYGSGNSSDHHQRIRLGNVVGGQTWTLHLTGLDVPASNDSDYFHLQAKRKVFVAVYWEDTDRDDADGPDSSIE